MQWILTGTFRAAFEESTKPEYHCSFVFLNNLHTPATPKLLLL